LRGGHAGREQHAKAEEIGNPLLHRYVSIQHSEKRVRTEGRPPIIKARVIVGSHDSDIRYAQKRWN
jgi:hypothetical protein